MEHTRESTPEHTRTLLHIADERVREADSRAATYVLALEAATKRIRELEARNESLLWTIEQQIQEELA